MVQLDLMVAVPVLLAVACVVVGRRWPSAARWIALAAPLGQGLLLVSTYRAGVFAGNEISGVSGLPVWALGTDGLSTPLVALTAAIGLMAVSASWDVERDPGMHFGLLALMQGALAAVFMAEDVILFYVAWESVLVPMFLLIGGWGSANSRKAAMKFLVFTFAGGAVLLLGVILTLVEAGTSSIPAIARMGATLPSQALIFWLLTIGFLVKVPAVGLHTWLPDAHTEAPTAGSIVLAGLLLKMGGYGLIRIAVPFAPSAYENAAWAIAALGVVGIIWGAATALVQSDLKRLVAYSSVSHMGFVLLAIGIGTPAALSAGLMTMISHGLVAGMLFYLVGALYQRSHTRELDRFGGLGSVSPRWASAFVFASLASAGLPALSGFPGEFMSLLEGFKAFGWWMVAPSLGLVLAAAYSLRAVRKTVQGEVGRVAGIRDLGGIESVTAALTALAVIVIGLAPWLVTRPATEALRSIAMLVGRGGR